MTSNRLLVAAACLAALGCGGGISAPRTVPVAGTVLIKGKPAAGVRVTFHPLFDIGPVKFTPSGLTDKNGRFTLSTASAAGDGAPPGDYAVALERMRVTADKAGVELEVDAWKGKYADPANRRPVTVGPGGNDLEPFRLDDATPGGPRA